MDKKFQITPSKDLKYFKVSEVVKGSVADELGVVPGDCLLAIDGVEIKDVFDYETRTSGEYMKLTFLLHDGVMQTVEVEKDETEIMGLKFEEPLMDKCMSCHNNCIFCFIAQLPKGMRETLYFKDDDVRMSFLTGNYVTLTNLNDEEFERILSYRFSPINVSVHTTNPELRSKMLNNRFAGNILERLKRIAESGSEINCQFVLCPGVNDGDELERSIKDLESVGDAIKSIAVVPVGLTKFRKENGLTEILPYDKEGASAVLEIVEKWQKHFLETRGTRLFYAADEFYIRAERELPDASEYEDFPQLENGVGLVSDFLNESDEELSAREGNKAFACTETGMTVWEVSGTDAYPYMMRNKERISKLYGINYDVVGAVNEFFGHTITVSGLLTGRDIINAVNKKAEEVGKRPEILVISGCMLKADEDVFLDDMTKIDFANELNMQVIVKRSTAGLYHELDRRFKKKSVFRGGHGRRL